MAHRPEWFPKENIGSPCSSVLRISVDVVGYIRGSYDCMPEHHALNVKALKWVVENWDYMYDCGREGDMKFDFAVLRIINIALEMEAFDKKRRGY